MSFEWSDAIYAARAGAVGLLVLSVPFVAWWGVRCLHRETERFCPGPARRWWRGFRPWGVLYRRGCGYPLVGLPSGEDATVVCPECGRVVRAGDGARGASPWRPGRFGATLVMLASVAWAAPMAKTTSWQRRVPTTVLIAAKRVLGPDATPERIRREVHRRLERGGLWGWQEAFVLPALAADLRDDGVTRNAEKALERMAAMGERGREQLERSLRSEEAQERRLAAGELRNLLVPWESTGDKLGERSGGRSRLVGEPSDDLLRVTLEFLGDRRPGWCMGIEHAGDPYAFLGFFPERVTPLVAEGMASEDAGHRLRCAVLAALMNTEGLRATAGAILIDALRGNDRRRDAYTAARGLYAMGPAAEGILEPYLYAADPQQRALARLVFQNLRKEPEWPGGFPAEEALWRFTFPGYAERQAAGER